MQTFALSLAALAAKFVTAADFNVTCQDSAWNKIGNGSKDCTWVSDAPKDRCVAKDADSFYAFEKCEASCGYSGGVQSFFW